MEPSEFLERTIDLNSKMDPLYPARYPHVGTLRRARSTLELIYSGDRSKSSRCYQSLLLSSEARSGRSAERQVSNHQVLPELNVHGDTTYTIAVYGALFIGLKNGHLLCVMPGPCSQQI